MLKLKVIEWSPFSILINYTDMFSLEQTPLTMHLMQFNKKLIGIFINYLHDIFEYLKSWTVQKSLLYLFYIFINELNI
jgi:hypothetical protein